MSTSVSIQLDTQLLEALAQKAKELNTDTQSLIVKAINDLLYWDKLGRMQPSLEEKANRQGFSSEEDVFDAIS